MLTRKLLLCFLMVPTSLVTGWTLTAQEQSDDTFAVPGAAVPLPPTVGPTAPRATTIFRSSKSGPATSFGLARSSWVSAKASEVDKAYESLKGAKSDEERSDAKASLRKALVTDYDSKMDQYDEHIESLEKELEEMRERLSRRRAAKEEMVDLKLKELVANADGLGWPSGPKSSINVRFPSTSPDMNRFLQTPPGSRAPTTIMTAPAAKPTAKK
ncbi:prefoldin domain-containing protein [Mariniblastus fucicola]|uniref:Uncharacterized protein n=1 Tax=Mariniblastus fucicola TaxID=980251 RepID=A0A5B9PBN3_9BACT|nr:hypothetical protein [Mariniblastus fucicola]QEG22312.1 hypothetical protein MFFC18_21880 [Mariniblastus fucicola]